MPSDNEINFNRDQFCEKERLTSRQGFDLELQPIDRASAAPGIDLDLDRSQSLF